MRTISRYAGASRTLDGRLFVSFEFDEQKQIEKLEKIKDKDLVVEVKQYRPKRSLNANAYFWKLCDLIASELGTTKDEVYILQLVKAGVFVDVQIKKEALAGVQMLFRHTKIMNESENAYYVRCYIGSSNYNSKQMASNGILQKRNEAY